MKPAFVLGRIGVAAGVFLIGADLSASHPDVLRSFRLIPSRSTLEQTGGFAGVHINYNLFDTFDIVTGFEDGVSCLAIGCPPPPTHVPFAKFENVRVYALDLHSPFAVIPQRIPLDHFVDLEKLYGEFRPEEPRKLYFKGFDSQRQPFDLLAVQRGPLLHLLGINHPRCCDLYNYKLDALAHIAPHADFNLDGEVDLADYITWRQYSGMSVDATLENGDADGDGDVDTDDYLAWRQQLGASTDMSAFAADSLADFALTSAAVPEPSSLALLLSFVVVSAMLGRHRQLG